MIEWIFTFLVVYLLYKLIFDFIIPVSKASAEIRSKVNQMHRQQQQQYTSAQQTTSQKKTASATVRPPADDYIDFEEIK